MKKNIYIITLLVIIFIVFIGYLKGTAMVNNDKYCIYVKINDNKWEKITNVDYNNKIIKANPGDAIYISLLENSTILYEWHMSTSKLKGLELTDKNKVIINSGIRSIFNVKEGDNFDRVVFEFRVTKAGEESLTFSYQPNEDTGINNYQIREFTLSVQK